MVTRTTMIILVAAVMMGTAAAEQTNTAGAQLHLVLLKQRCQGV